MGVGIGTMHAWRGELMADMDDSVDGRDHELLISAQVRTWAWA